MKASLYLFLSWLSIWTNTIAGAHSYSDPQNSVVSRCFYRARLP